MQSDQNSNSTPTYPSLGATPVHYQPQEVPFLMPNEQDRLKAMEVQLRLADDRVRTLEEERQMRIQRRQCTPLKCVIFLLIFITLGVIMYFKSTN